MASGGTGDLQDQVAARLESGTFQKNLYKTVTDFGPGRKSSSPKAKDLKSPGRKKLMSNKVQFMEDSPTKTANVSMFDNTQIGEGGLDGQPRSDASANPNQMEEAGPVDQPKDDSDVPGTGPVGGKRIRNLGTCKTCNETFNSTRGMNVHRQETKHLITEHRRKTKCAYCGQEVFNIKDHTVRSHNERMQSCPVGCGTASVPGRSFERHMRSCHPGESWDPVTLPVTFEPAIVENSVTSQPGSIEPGATENPDTSESGTTEPVELDVALGNPDNQVLQEALEAAQPPESTSQAKCTICGREFRNWDLLMAHARQHHSVCTVCHKTFKLKSLLTRHQTRSRCSPVGAGGTSGAGSPSVDKKRTKRLAENDISSANKKVTLSTAGCPAEDCGYASSSLEEMDEHLRENHPEMLVGSMQRVVYTYEDYLSLLDSHKELIQKFDTLQKDNRTLQNSNKNLRNQLRQEEQEKESISQLHLQASATAVADLVKSQQAVAKLQGQVRALKNVAVNVKIENEVL